MEEDAPRWRFMADALGDAARYRVPREAMAWALRDLPLAPGMRVLEVGCGAGGYTQMLMEALGGRGAWTCVDHDAELLRQARENVRAPESVALRFERADALKLPFADGAFDAVVSAFLLCVLPSPLAALREMRRVTKPGGLIGSLSCFCKSGSLPIFHGIEAWDGLERYQALQPRVRSAFRQGIRNPGLGIPSGKDLDVWGDHAKAGLVDLQMTGYLTVYAPADKRWSDEDAADWLSRREKVETNLFDRLAKEGVHKLAPFGVTPAEVDEYRELTKRRYAFLRADLARSRSNMDAFADPNVLITGRVPP